MRLARLLDKLVIPTRVLIVFAIGAVIAHSGYFFIFGPQTSKSVVVPESPTSVGSSVVSLEKITSSNLFGSAQSSVGSIENIASTRLNLYLIAVIRNAEFPDESIAWIAYGNNEPDKYQIGGTIAGVAALMEIHRTQVVIKRAGKLERLAIARDNDWLTEAPISVAANRADLDRVGSFPQGRGASESSTQPYPMTEDRPSKAIDSGSNRAEEIYESYKDQIAKDPAAVLQEWGMAPVSKSDARGYLVNSSLEREGLGRVGIQAGDVLLSVNGNPIGDVERDRSELMDTLRGDMARVEVQRGQRKFFINVALN